MLCVSLLFVVFVLILVLLIISSKKLDYWKTRHVKYIKPTPIFGNMLPLVLKTKPVAEMIVDMYKAFPNERYVGFFQFLTPMLMIRDPELVKTMSIKNFDNFVDHSGIDITEVDPLWSKNLFVSRGQRWRELRQTISPVFTSSKMRNMFLLMEDCAKQLSKHFIESNQEIIEIELKDIFTKYTNDVIASTAFGIQCDSLKHPNNEFLLSGQKLADFSGIKRFAFILYASYPNVAKFLRMKVISDGIGNFFKNVINDTIKLREEKNIVRPDLIHLLMLARNGKLTYEDYLNSETPIQSEIPDGAPKFLTNEDITAQAIVFFLGGFETSSSAMCFMAYELAINPKIQKTLREEIIDKYKECGGKITYDGLLGLKYLDMVLCETMRKWPQAYWLDRQCTKTFHIKPQNEGETSLKINEGDICWFPAIGLHRDPKYYENPERFDPERFNDNNKGKILNGTYLPFGIGPRNCIGSRFALLEAKILFYHLLLQFEFVPTSKTSIPLKLRKDTAFILPEGGFHLGLKRQTLY